MHNGTTITQFIIEEQRKIQGATGDFTSLLNDIVTACKVISNLVNKGEPVGVPGSAGSENVQGETQKKLDIITNEWRLSSGPRTRSSAFSATIASMTLRRPPEPRYRPRPYCPQRRKRRLQ